MLKKTQLHNLTPTQLLFLQKHIKLGKDHLEQILSPNEIRDLFQIATVPAPTKRELSTTKIEIAGVSALVVNTILTATLGAWMGLSGFLQLNMHSIPRFIGILTFSISFGALIGYQNGRFRINASKATLDKRKLQDLELSILNELSSQRKEEVKAKQAELKNLLKNLNIDVDIDELEQKKDYQKVCLNWISYLIEHVQNHRVGEFTDLFISELEDLKLDFTHKTKKEVKKVNERDQFNIIVEKLSEVSIQPPVVLPSWIKTNLDRLIVELMPTVFGGFSSLFVYLGGAPQLAQQFGKPELFEFLMRPEIKTIEFLSAILVTLYFAFSFLYLNRKAFLRDQEIAKMQIYLTREENMMDVLDDLLLKVKELIRVMQPIEFVFRMFKHHKKK
jgi:hypothetical protein